MPQTKSGKEVLANMIKEYGEKKGRSVYFASIVKGKPGSSKWEGKGGTGKLAKAKKTFSKEHPKEMIAAMKKKKMMKGEKMTA